MKAAITFFILFWAGFAVAQSGISTSYMRMTPTALPATCRRGDVRVDSTNFFLQICSPANTWEAVANQGGSGSLSIGTIDTASSPSANGLNLIANVLYPQSATASAPGMVNTGTQTFAGTKTFSSTISGSVNGNAATATALASIPSGCSASQFASSISANGNLGCLPVAASYLNGTVSVANGGTGQTSGTSGGIPYYSSTSAISSSALLVSDELVVGGGSGGPPVTLGSYGSSGYVLTSNGSASLPSWASAPPPSFSALTQYGAMYATATTAIGSTSAGSASYPLLAGNSGPPSFQPLSLTSAGITGTLAVANGGTGTATAPTLNGVIYAASTASYASTAAGTVGQVLAVPGVGSAPVFASMAYSNISSAITTASYSTFLSNSGSQAGVLFSITAPGSNVSAGAVYTNNSGSFTVLNAVTTAQSGWILFTTNTSTAPTGSTLTKSSGTGPSTITFGAAQQLEAYTTPSSPSPIVLHITMAGAGGGGGSSGTGSTNAGTGGIPTSLCSSAGIYFVANGGAGGNGGASAATVGGAGGTNTSDGGLGNILSPGGSGAGPIDAIFGSITESPGGSGGTNPLGGGAAGNAFGTSNAGAVNTGAGGAGGGTGATSSSYAGGGGGAGAYQDFWLTNPSATYYYSVGSTGSGTGGGAGGSAGSSGNAGGQGGSGYLRIIAEFQ